MTEAALPIYRGVDRHGINKRGFMYTLVNDRDFSPIEHRHDFYEILILYSGKVRHIVNGTAYDMTGGQLYLVRPGDSHLPVRLSPRLSACMFSVSRDFIAPFLFAYGLELRVSRMKDGALCPMDGGRMEQLRALFQRQNVLGAENGADEMRVVMGCVCQCVLLAQGAENDFWIERVKREMNTPEHMAEGVSAIMRIANLSHPQLCRVFKKLINQTPQQFVKEIRLSYAYNMVRDTDLPYANIAEMVGYSSFSYFAQAFKARYQQTPSELRKKTMKYW